MRAMVLERQGAIESSPLHMRGLPEPQPQAGEVRIKVTACAVCRTDLHIVEGDLPLQKTLLVPGHQIVGIVDQLGPQCQRIKIGQRIGAAWLRHTDGSCTWCRRGQENLCPESRYTGYDDDGGYAEYALVPEEFAYELPGGLDDVTVSPLLCAGMIGYRALERARVPEGTERGKLLLVGFGSSAHVVIQIAAFRGQDVYVLTRQSSHQDLARRLGAKWAGSKTSELPVKADSAILFAPVGELVPPTLEALAPGGTLAVAGISLTDIPALNYERHVFHEKTLCSVTANTRDDGRKLLAEAVAAKVRPLVTTYALADANRALQEMKRGKIDGTAVLCIS